MTVCRPASLPYQADIIFIKVVSTIFETSRFFAGKKTTFDCDDALAEILWKYSASLSVGQAAHMCKSYLNFPRRGKAKIVFEEKIKKSKSLIYTKFQNELV